MNISQLNDLEESLIEEKVAKYRLKLQNAHKEKVESRKKHIIAAENNIRKAEEDLPQVLNEIEEKIKKGINCCWVFHPALARQLGNALSSYHGLRDM